MPNTHHFRCGSIFNTFPSDSHTNCRWDWDQNINVKSNRSGKRKCYFFLSLLMFGWSGIVDQPTNQKDREKVFWSSVVQWREPIAFDWMWMLSLKDRFDFYRSLTAQLPCRKSALEEVNLPQKFNNNWRHWQTFRQECFQKELRKARKHFFSLYSQLWNSNCNFSSKCKSQS